MEIIEKTVQEIGGKCLGIIIPRKWTKKLGIKKGTKLVLHIESTYIEIKLSKDEDYKCPF